MNELKGMKETFHGREKCLGKRESMEYNVNRNAYIIF